MNEHSINYYVLINSDLVKFEIYNGDRYIDIWIISEVPWTKYLLSYEEYILYRNIIEKTNLILVDKVKDFHNLSISIHEILYDIYEKLSAEYGDILCDARFNFGLGYVNIGVSKISGFMHANTNFLVDSYDGVLKFNDWGYELCSNIFIEKMKDVKGNILEEFTKSEILSIYEEAEKKFRNFFSIFYDKSGLDKKFFEINLNGVKGIILCTENFLHGINRLRLFTNYGLFLEYLRFHGYDSYTELISKWMQYTKYDDLYKKIFGDSICAIDISFDKSLGVDEYAKFKG